MTAPRPRAAEGNAEPPVPAAATRLGGAAGLSLQGVITRGQFRLELALELGPGRVLGVLGPNGSGKSTLLRTIAGLNRLSGGELTLNGTLVDGAGVFVPPRRRRVGMVFQDYRLFPTMSVLDNVAFGQRSQGLGRQQANSLAHEWLVRFGIDDLADRKPHQISGGQAQRVALARALASQPQVLVLDEPLAALDSQTRAAVATGLADHLHAFGGTVLMVTHDALEALVIADELVVLEDGRVTQRGSTAEVSSHPATPWIARLMGVNLLRGHLQDDVVQLDGGGVLQVGAGRPSGRVLVSLRPNAVTVHANNPGVSSSRNIWPGTIDSLDLLTDRVRVGVTGEPSVLVDVTAAAVAELALKPGSRVWLSAKAMEMVVYPES